MTTAGDLTDLLVPLAICLGVAFAAGMAVRHWPLSWRSTARRLGALRAREKAWRLAADAATAFAEGRADAERERASVAARAAEDGRRQMTSMQAAFEDAMRRLHDPWRRHAELVLRRVEDRPFGAAYVAQPARCDIADGPYPARTAAVRETRLVRFVVSIGLSDDCPPELVARHIADTVRADILAHWRHQSLLGNRT